MNETNIGWTDFSSNLIKYRDPDGNVVNACIKASEGCRHCYAETLAPRWGRKGKPFTSENMKRLTPFFDEKEANVVLRSKKISGKRVFVNDMTDWMGPWIPGEIIDQCMALFVLRSDVTFQTLTKHADRQLSYFGNPAKTDRWSAVHQELNVAARRGIKGWTENYWPNHARHIHIGVSAEDQHNADRRIPLLLETPAAMRFVSYEPALGPVDFDDYLYTRFIMGGARHMSNQLDWIIAGGESGAGHRSIPDNERWIEKVVVQCHKAKVPIFVKQDSGPKPGKQGRIADEFFVQEFPNAHSLSVQRLRFPR